ncbi:MAG TPA: hypothetical protein VKT33_08600 [Candidatus Angelobacter sp.]|nr:hypothetical protein [Candidatus Angelobacter sp.]
MPKFFRRHDSYSAALIVWSSITITDLRLSLEASNRLILWYVYGRKLVAHNHLSLVQTKPRLAVSNGDVLNGLGPLHYLFGIFLWITTATVIVVLVMKYLAPEWWSQASMKPPKQGGNIGIIASLVMFIAILALPLFPALILGVVAAATGIWWLRNSGSPEASSSYGVGCSRN